MPKRRRKLSSEMEKQISLISKRVELITAIINDIADEDLQGEYRQAFSGVSAISMFLAKEYKENGVTEDSKGALNRYSELIKEFENEYEI